jgi:methyl-accepting chemotaxis protein
MPQPRKPKRVTLGDRMDALAQTVELLASMHEDTDRHVNEVAASVERLVASVDRLATVVTPIAQLVLEHEERLKKLEK